MPGKWSQVRVFPLRVASGLWRRCLRLHTTRVHYARADPFREMVIGDILAHLSTCCASMSFPLRSRLWRLSLLASISLAAMICLHCVMAFVIIYALLSFCIFMLMVALVSVNYFIADLPPAKRRRTLAGSIVSTAVSAALIGTAVGLTVYRL
jgi:hypothetical protein